MNTPNEKSLHRVLVIDDNRAIHDDYRKIFNVDATANDMAVARANLFDDAPPNLEVAQFELAFADQGQSGCELARLAVAQGIPFAVAFVDMRMPPGWDGVQTIEELWKIDPHVQVVLATAYSEQSWQQVLERIGGNNQLLILRKPFENIEVWQLAHALSQKWSAERTARDRAAALEDEVATRTVDLIRTNEDLVAEMAAGQQAIAQRLVLERRLLESQKLESLGVVASGIAHDFNNLLTAIIANASLLRDECADKPTAMGFIDQIDSASMTAAGLCHQMLAYAGKGQFEISDVEINQLIEDLFELLRSIISKKAHLRVELVPSAIYVRGDVIQLKQVIMNLVANASDALEDHPGDILITTEVIDCDRQTLDETYRALESLPGRFVRVVVRDSGSGMAPETLARIFDPFFSTKFIGRGLGLASVQGIVRGHRGALAVETNLGSGSAFSVLLPLAEHAIVAPGKAKVARSTYPQNSRILLVDDEEIVRISTHRILKALGYDSDMARNGREALEVIESNPPDFYSLIILDVTMPELSGTETLKELRKRGLTVPVILTSGFNAESIGPELNEANNVKFLRKPYELEDLRNFVADVLGPRN